MPEEKSVGGENTQAASDLGHSQERGLWFTSLYNTDGMWQPCSTGIWTQDQGHGAMAGVWGGIILGSESPKPWEQGTVTVVEFGKGSRHL